MIAVDWGTSNFRAYRLDSAGEVRERLHSARGMLAVVAGTFAEALQAEVGPWLAAGETRVLLCGMVGSRQGWAEVPYLPCPAGLDDLAQTVVPVPFTGAEVLLVPGLICTDPTGVPEVMRGEETAAIGVLVASGGEGTVCLPGTHSKWVSLSRGKIVAFTTSMTGEVYSALRKGTILGRMMADADAIDFEAFDRGAIRSVDPGGLLHHLFGVRTLTLTDQLEAGASAAYLSGLLIGHEVRTSLVPGRHVHLVGAPALCDLYQRVIQSVGSQSIGTTTTIAHEDAAAHGLAAIGRELAWI